MRVERDRPLSSDTVLDLIGRLYEGPLEPEPWRGFGERLRALLGARAVAITLHYAAGVTFDTYVMASEPGDSTDWTEVENFYRQRFLADDPRRLDLVQAGEVLAIDNRGVSPDVDRFLESYDIGACLRTRVDEPGGMCCWVDVVRARKPGIPFATTEVEFVRKLLPHLARALRLFSVQKRQELERRVYEETIEHFVLGTVLLDAECTVMHLNRAAEAIISTHRGISVSRGRLRLADAQARDKLNSALQRAQVDRDIGKQAPQGELVRIDTTGGKPLAMLVHPIAQTRYYQGAHVPSAVLYLVDVGLKLDALQPAREASQALVAELFGLTPQEARLALLLADGCTLADAAGRIGVAESAARSYSKRIYAKMGIKSQSDIVRLVYRSFAMLR